MPEPPTKITPDTALLRMLVNNLVSLLLITFLAFAGAGRLDWGFGWVFIAVWGLSKLSFALLLRWHDPELLVERATRHENTQPYDRRILPVYSVLSFFTILVAGIDNGRFHWSGQMPAALIILAYVIYLLGNMLSGWAVIANPFFSSESRFQSDRNQAVTRTGPYRFLRHPAYLATIILGAVTPLLMGSWWAVIPGLLSALMILIRTAYEDRMLRAELPGYAEYAEQVHFRLFPAIW
jgi:protein-S-isoprenylcysteine O-methyltransferase Ste14